MKPAFTFDEIKSLFMQAKRRDNGRYDLACPLCSASKDGPSARRRVLGIWEVPGGFTYSCIRCDVSGRVSAPGADLSRAIVRPLAPPNSRNVVTRIEPGWRLEMIVKARRLWSRTLPIDGTPAETYLRRRGLQGPFPATVRYIPPDPQIPDPSFGALVAPFGHALQLEEGGIEIDEAAVVGIVRVYVTPDGRKAPIDVPKRSMGMVKAGRPGFGRSMTGSRWRSARAWRTRCRSLRLWRRRLGGRRGGVPTRAGRAGAQLRRSDPDRRGRQRRGPPWLRRL